MTVTDTQQERTKRGIPERTLDQRQQALSKANRIRSKRAQLKLDLKAGRTSIHDILLKPPSWVESMKVFDVLLACPHYGKVKVNKILEFCRVSPSKTIGGITQRQRLDIVSMMRR